MNSQEIITKMQELLTVISVEQSKPQKKYHNLARKASSELKKLAGEFKKTSSNEDKAA